MTEIYGNNDRKNDFHFVTDYANKKKALERLICDWNFLLKILSQRNLAKNKFGRHVVYQNFCVAWNFAAEFIFD